MFPDYFIYDGDKIFFEYKSNSLDLSDKSKVSFSAIVNIKEYNTKMNIIRIYNETNISNEIYDYEKYYRNYQLIGKKTLSLCKSNLQKCIRKKMTDEAIRTALAIYRYNPNELLRRLPIIMIEDTLPHPEFFGKLVWWMCAVSKGYKLTHNELKEIFNCISTMCESSTYEVFTSKLLGIDIIDDIIEKEIDKLSIKEQTFIWVLEIRKLYKGMKCDRDMLGYHQQLWLQRFLSQKSDDQKSKNTKWYDRLIDQVLYDIDLSSIDDFNKDDILIESIDYHPYPFIPKKIIEKIKNNYNDNDLNIPRIKLIIWMCRSRTNYRTPINMDTFVPITNDLNNDYKLIKKELDTFCSWLLSKINLTE